MPCTEGCSEVASWQSVARVHEYLNHVVQEIGWADSLGPFNHCPHFPFFPLAPGTLADVLIWDGYGPSRTRGDFFDFEVGGHDGAYKGQIHVIVPFIGRKNGTLTARQQSYMHGWYRAHIEQPFARLWHWGLVRNMWRGGPNELHQSVHILLHFTQFCICRQGRHPPPPPMDHGSMSRLMFGLTEATRPPCRMRQRMRQKCVCCVVRSIPPSQFVVLNVLTPTLVGPMLFVKYNTNDIWSC